MMGVLQWRLMVCVVGLCMLVCMATARAEGEALTAAEATGIFSQGTAAYRVGDLKEAAEHFQQLVDSGYDSPEILYNLGTVEARLNHTGRALGYLTKAREGAPRSADIRFNLQKLRAANAVASGAGDEAEAENLSGESLWYRVVFFLTLTEWLALLWLLATFFAGAVLLRVLKADNPRQAKLFRGIAWAGGLLLVALLVPFAGRCYYLSLDRRVAITDTGVHSGPSSRFTENARLSEGTLIRVMTDNVDGYCQVRLDNGQVGYVNREDLLQL